jgi:rod shape determining protein RodA
MKKRYTPPPMYRLTFSALHIDFILLSLIILLIATGLTILYSAAGQDVMTVGRQAIRLVFALIFMLFLAFIPPHRYRIIAPWLYSMSMFLLIAVMLIGKIGKGAQRWLDLGFIRFQPSELMKLALPLMIAWYFDTLQNNKSYRPLFIASMIILLPTLLIAKQPDLGTAILVLVAGATVMFVAGIHKHILWGIVTLFSATLPIIWHFLHDYQKQRIYTLLNPEADPLGKGYHIIQSKIAIGSGGLLGKGYLMGTQSHLNFLPEHATDFIFAVNGEEFGFVGGVTIIVLMMLIGLRGFYIALNAQTPFTSFLAASLTLSFFFSAFVNMGMVMGILPVVGIPLPLVSYGGTAMVTFLASFGILMSISTHRILFPSIPSK